MNRVANCFFAASAAVAFGASGAGAQIFSENFDSYKAGSNIAGQGGWETWCTGGSDAAVSDAHAHSKPNSLRDTPASDIVQRFNETSGQLVFSFFVYVPSDASGGSGSINLMNTYCEGQDSTMAWSVSTSFSPDSGLVTAYTGETAPLIEDQWAEYRAEIDLDNDTLNEFYNGQQLVFNHTWTGNISPGPLEFRAADFYDDTLSEVFFDDITLERRVSCYPDFDGNGTLDLFDFLAFLNAFNVNDPNADCDHNGVFDLFDFLCFLNAFNAGC